MEKTESNRIILSDRDVQHETLMLEVLKRLQETPLVLKGGTALYLGYGLTRFSEDLDFDSPRKISLINKMKNLSVPGVEIFDVISRKETDSASRVVMCYRTKNFEDRLKIEVSYRTPAPPQEIVVKNGIKFSTINRIASSKLEAAFDGDKPRVKIRDLFDLHFISKNYIQELTPDVLGRLVAFSDDPDRLAQLYQLDAEKDPLLKGRIDLETLVLELGDVKNYKPRSVGKVKPFS